MRLFNKFIVLVLFCLVLTIYLSYHATTVLFGDNSLQVYNSLKYKKEYFELKNLEPEEWKLYFYLY